LHPIEAHFEGTTVRPTIDEMYDTHAAKVSAEDAFMSMCGSNHHYTREQYRAAAKALTEAHAAFLCAMARVSGTGPFLTT
jgi:hypothetical protein